MRHAMHYAARQEHASTLSVASFYLSEKDSCDPKDGKWGPERGTFAEPAVYYSVTSHER